jgi:hypothetical protein
MPGLRGATCSFVYEREALERFVTRDLLRLEPVPVLAVAGVLAVDTNLAVDRGHTTAETAVDRLLRHPERRDRLTALSRALE